MVTYETGIATSPADLLTKLTTFLLANGWQVSAPTGGDAVIYNDPSGTIFAGVDVTATEWHRRGCTGYNGAAAWNAQPGAAAFTDICNFGAGPYTAYHFFLGDEDGREYVHMAVEVAANVYRHWLLGELVKFGTWDGGQYNDSVFANLTSTLNGQNNSGDFGGHRMVCDASHNSALELAHILIEYDGKVMPNWQRVRTAGTVSDADACAGSNRSQGIFAPMWTTEDQIWNLRTAMWPAVFFANRGTSLVSPIGRVPNLRLVSMRNFTAGEVVTYGGDDWMIFPNIARYQTAPAAGTPSSGLYGVAHKRP